MISVHKAFTPLAFVFFIPLVFIGAFFLLNLTLAVIKASYEKEHQKKQEKGKESSKANKFKSIRLPEASAAIESEEELQKRRKVLKRLRVILFLKCKMRQSIRRFRERKARLKK